jgi:ribosomal-protein-alanine N-acetyltransferase
MHETRTLSTDRLILRPLTLDDLFAYHLVMSQDAVGRQLPRGTGYTGDQTRALLDFWIDHWTQFAFGPWAVIEASTSTLIGHCGLRHLEETDETELLYALGQSSWGRGYATEAARASTSWAFDVLGVRRLSGFVKPDNAGSRAVMRHCGFVEVGLVQQWGLDLVKYRKDAP